MSETQSDWAGGARVVVVVQLLVEQWLGPGEAARTTSSHMSEEDHRLGRPDLLSGHWQRYSAEVATPRVMQALARLGVQATGVFSGLTAERYPGLIRDWAAAGHDLAAHAYSQDSALYAMDEATERSEIERTAAFLRDSCGQLPTGWLSPQGQRSARTVSLLDTLGFRYTFDPLDDEVPYGYEHAALIAIPRGNEISDVPLYLAGSTPPKDYVEFFKSAFDVLYEEGAARPKLLHLTVHGPLFGKPFGASALEECISYARGFSDVWWATGSQIAEKFLRSSEPEKTPREGD